MAQENLLHACSLDEEKLPQGNKTKGSNYSRRHWIAASLAALGALASFGQPALAQPKQEVVLVGEVETRVRKNERWLARTLRKTVHQELAQIALPGNNSDRYVLSVSLTQLYTTQPQDQRKQSSGASETASTAVISGVLRNAKTGAIHAILRGKATAMDGAGPVRELEITALQGAMRSALKKVPEAISQTPKG